MTVGCCCYWLLLRTAVKGLVYMKKVGFFCSFGFVKERRVLLVFVVVVLGSVSGVSEG